MISIFNGREQSLTGSRKRLFVQFELEFLDKYLPFFRYNNSSDSLVVFMAMVGHIDSNGWCFPSHQQLHQQTGIKKAHTMGYLISVLNTIVLPMPAGEQKLVNYWSGRLPNGHMKSYYHIFPGAGNEDLAPEPFIDKELMRPGLVGERRRKRKTLPPDGPEAPAEGASSLLEPYAGLRHMGQPYAGVRHAGVRHINYNQESLTRLKPRPPGELGEPPMSLSALHITVEQTLNKTRQRAQVYPCQHCQATIDQHQTACPGCGAAIVWQGNDVLARDARKAAAPARPKPTYTGAAAWLLAFAQDHPAGLKSERIFYRDDRGEADSINRFAARYGEPLVQAKAQWALSQNAVGRGLIVTTLNALTAHDPSFRARRRPAGLTKPTLDAATLQTIWDNEPD